MKLYVFADDSVVKSVEASSIIEAFEKMKHFFKNTEGVQLILVF